MSVKSVENPDAIRIELSPEWNQEDRIVIRPEIIREMKREHPKQWHYMFCLWVDIVNHLQFRKDRKKQLAIRFLAKSTNWSAPTIIKYKDELVKYGLLGKITGLSRDAQTGKYIAHKYLVYPFRIQVKQIYQDRQINPHPGKSALPNNILPKDNIYNNKKDKPFSLYPSPPTSKKNSILKINGFTLQWDSIIKCYQHKSHPMGIIRTLMPGKNTPHSSSTWHHSHILSPENSIYRSMGAKLFSNLEEKMLSLHPQATAIAFSKQIMIFIKKGERPLKGETISERIDEVQIWINNYCEWMGRDYIAQLTRANDFQEKYGQILLNIKNQQNDNKSRIPKNAVQETGDWVPKEGTAIS